MEEEHRVWGYYRVLYRDDCCKIKHLYIEPGKNISYQSHRHREEHWVVVQGRGKCLLNGQTLGLTAGDRITIAVNHRHAVRNTGDETLIIHEVQLGEEFEESDIIREALPSGFLESEA